MTSDEILGQLPKLTEEEKRQLWDILNQQLADQFLLSDPEIINPRFFLKDASEKDPPRA